MLDGKVSPDAYMRISDQLHELEEMLGELI
jgi:hypothetical protein